MAIRVFAAGVLATDLRHGREVVITQAADVSSEERRRCCRASSRVGYRT